ncbi:transglutaminase family protein [bacterium]|nr:transglutaminase family protein [bacterium]
MILDIRHHTSCRYDRAVSNARLELRLSPPDGEDQKLLDRSFRFTPDASVVTDRDTWGNTVEKICLPDGSDAWSFDLRMTVQTFRTDPFAEYCKWNFLPAPSAPGGWPREVRTYLASPDDPWDSDPAIRSWARSTVDGVLGAFRQVQAMMEHIHRNFRFVPGSTDNQTSPATLLARKQGVCQDFSNLLICAARSIGIPARYVSGYVYTGKDSETAATNHAWVECFFPEIGWAGFDPANGAIVSDAHVRLAHGARFADANPLNGVFTGRGVNQQVRTAIQVGKAGRGAGRGAGY